MGRKGHKKLQQQPRQQHEEVKDTEEVRLKARNPGQYDQPSLVCPLCEQKYRFADYPFRHNEEQEWREVPEHPQPRREEREPFPSSEEMLDWVSDPEWNWKDFPKVVDLLWARDGEHWEHWKQHYWNRHCRLPAPEGEVPPLSPEREGETHQSPASEGDLHQSPATGRDYTLLPPPSPGDYTLLPPPSPGDYMLLPPPSPEDNTLLPHPALPPLGAEQQELPLPPPQAEQQ
ncbi:UNVERIFIED_CONTAM: hypothetical protein FKN15_037056 [Acipenser sinensis]